MPSACRLSCEPTVGLITRVRPLPAAATNGQLEDEWLGGKYT
jgi:hypothetical protein